MVPDETGAAKCSTDDLTQVAAALSSSFGVELKSITDINGKPNEADLIESAIDMLTNSGKW